MRVVLPFKLVGQKLVKGRDFPKSVADGSKDSIVIKVGGIPDGCIAKCYFKLSWESNTTYDLTFNGDELVVDEYIVTLPSHANNKYIDYKFSFSVAIWEGDVERLTTNPVEIVVEKSNYTDETTNTPDIPESQYDALAQSVADVVDLTNSINEDVADHGRRITDLEKGGGSGELVVTFEGSGRDTANYTSGDIYSHIANGGTAVFFDGNHYSNLTMCEPNEAVFCQVWDDNTIYRLVVSADAGFEEQEIYIPQSGGGGITVTDDGKGNVTITASAGVSITDDGNGNVTIV